MGALHVFTCVNEALPVLRKECERVSISLLFENNFSCSSLDSTISYIQGGPMSIVPFDNKAYEGMFAASHDDESYFFADDVNEQTAKTLCNMLGYG